MNIIYLSLFLFILFFQTYSVIPIWDFNSQSIDLFPSQDSSYSYTTYSNADVKLEKIFIRNNGVITYINKLTIGDKSTQVLFDDIESVYQNQLGCEILICPKGKFHPFDFYNNRNITPTGFEEKGDWELKCFKHDTGFFLITYLMNDGDKSFYFAYNDNEIKKTSFYFSSNLYDFILEQGANEYHYEYKFPKILDDCGYIKLKGGILIMDTIDSNQIYMNDIEMRFIIESKAYSKAYFDENFFFIFLLMMIFLLFLLDIQHNL